MIALLLSRFIKLRYFFNRDVQKIDNLKYKNERVATVGGSNVRRGQLYYLIP